MLAPERVTVPAPVLVTDPAPEIAPEKVAVPPLTAVSVATLLLVIAPEKVAEPASLMPRVPEPLGPPRVLMTKLSMAIASRLPPPVEALRFTTRKTKLLRSFRFVLKSELVKFVLVVPHASGVVHVPSEVNDVGFDPIPYWRVQMLVLACELSNMRSREMELTTVPVVLKAYVNEAPGSKGALPAGLVPRARLVEASCAAVVEFEANPVAEAKL